MAEQAENITPPSAAPEQLPNLTPKNPPKTVIFAVFILILSGAVFAGIQIGQKQTPKTPSEILFNQPTIVPVTPTPDPTAGWKTYTNSQYGFEFKYPGENYSITNEKQSSVTIGFKPSPEATEIAPILSISIDPQDLLNYQSFKSCSKTNIFPCIDDGKNWGQIQDISQIEVGGLKANSFYYRQTEGDNVKHIVQINTHKKIIFNMQVAGAGLDSTFRQILSTFKFIE